MPKLSRAVVSIAVLLALGGACRYAPSFENCVIPCQRQQDCPSRLLCGPHGFCGETSSSCPATTPRWTAVSSGLEGAAVYTLAIDPTTRTTVYAGTESGVWKSVDGAATWKAMNAGLAQRAVRALAIDPNAPATLYAGMNSAGVYKSTDGGTSWKPVNGGPPGMESKTIYALGVDPDHPGYVFAGLAGPKVYVSANAGDRWDDVSLGIAPHGPETRSFAFNASGFVYAATFGAGLLRMPYNGTQWTPVGGADLEGTSRYLNAVAFAGGKVYVAKDQPISSLYRSGGAAFAPQTGFAGTAYSLAAAPLRLYVGSATGVFRTDDDIAFTSGRGIAEKVNAMALDPIDPDVAYAGTATGVYKTTDGFNWSVAIKGMTGHPIVALARDPRNPSNLYCAASGPGFRRSTDGGASWSPSSAVGSLPLTQEISALAVENAAPNLVWAATAQAIWSSSDRGVSWQQSLAGAFTSLAVSATAPNTVYTGALGPATTTVYAKQGLNDWTATTVGLPTTRELVAALAVNRTNSLEVFAAVTDRGVYRTVNGGTAWSLVASGLGSLKVLSLAMNAAQPATVYAGTFDQGVWRTTNAGQSWSLSSNGLTFLGVTAVAVSPSVASIVYVGTRTDGVFRSDDGGTSWRDYSSDLGTRAITQLVVDPANADAVYVGTWDGGVWKTVVP